MLKHWRKYGGAMRTIAEIIEELEYITREAKNPTANVAGIWVLALPLSNGSAGTINGSTNGSTAYKETGAQ